MADVLTREQRHKNMKNIRGKDTKIEVILRKALWNNCLLYTSTMAKMHRACQDNYVTQKGRVRRLTPRECARLQGFEDSFVIPVSDLSLIHIYFVD